MLTRKHLNRKDAAAYLKQRIGIGTPNSLNVMACKGIGPQLQYFGKKPYYHTDRLDEWIAHRISDPTTKSWAGGAALGQKKSDVGH